MALSIPPGHEDRVWDGRGSDGSAGSAEPPVLAERAAYPSGVPAPDPGAARAEDQLDVAWGARDGQAPSEGDSQNSSEFSPLPWHQQISVAIAERLGNTLARCPGGCVCAGIVLVSTVSAIGVIFKPPTINASFDEFLASDVQSSIMLAGFEAARDARGSGYQDRRLTSGSDNYEEMHLALAYELREGPTFYDGIFDQRVVTLISNFERHLRGLPEWQGLCQQSTQPDECQRGASISAYTRPTMQYARPSDFVPASVAFDGLGVEYLEPRVVYDLLMAHDLVQVVMPTYVQPGLSLSRSSTFPTSDELASTRVVRSVFRFYIRCCLQSAPIDERERGMRQARKIWREFFIDTLRPILDEGITAENEDGKLLINVWYDGTNFEEMSVMAALQTDMMLALGSLVFVFSYLVFHTRSFLLSLVGPFIALLAVPLTYVVFAVLFDATTMNFANFLSIFLMVGFGADVIFVYTDFWHSSKSHWDPEDYGQRLAWTFHHAARASLATTATTSLSFLANLASVIRALRTFGLFMGLSVLVAWLLLTLLYAPLCVWEEQQCQCCHVNLGFARTFFKSKVGLRQRAILAWTRHLRRWRIWYVVITSLAGVAFLGSALPNMEIATELPSIFPRDHTQNRGKEVMKDFESITDVLKNLRFPAETLDFCDASAFTEQTTDCRRYWCEANAILSQGQTSGAAANTLTCNCYDQVIQEAGCTTGGATSEVELQIYGPDGQIDLNLNHYFEIRDIVSQRYGTVNGVFEDASVSTGGILSPTLLQEWTSGLIEMKDAHLVRAHWLFSDAPRPCRRKAKCFCGDTLKCALGNSWNSWQPFQLTNPQAPIRRLQTGITYTVPVDQRAKVRVVFGIKVADEVEIVGDGDLSELWGFSPEFAIDDPWTQRNLLKFCTDMPEDLAVAASWCWMRDFKNHVTSAQVNSRFPIRSPTVFHDLAAQYINSNSGVTSGLRYLWFIDGRVRALYYSYELNARKNMKARVAMEYKAAWDRYLASFNSMPDVTMKTGRGAFHVSQVWVLAESTDVIIQTGIHTVIILLGLAFAGMLVFTWSFILSMYVALATVLVMCGLVFSIVIMMKQAVGLLEVIAIIYFIGYAVTFSLHIAHKYACDEAPDCDHDDEDLQEHRVKARVRFKRTAFAVTSIGGATVGSAVTTAGAAFFLLFCTLSVFQRLGSMCLVVTILSIIVAMGPLPGALLAFGPLSPGECLQGRELVEQLSERLSMNMPTLSDAKEREQE